MLINTQLWFSGNGKFSVMENRLKYLDLSRSQNSGNNEEDVLVQITASSQLEKLSLGCLYISNNFVKSIQKSALTLKVLDLSDCRGTTWHFHLEIPILLQEYILHLIFFFIFHTHRMPQVHFFRCLA